LIIKSLIPISIKAVTFNIVNVSVVITITYNTTNRKSARKVIQIAVAKFSSGPSLFYAKIS
jgi:hypothetical protein